MSKRGRNIGFYGDDDEDDDEDDDLIFNPESSKFRNPDAFPLHEIEEDDDNDNPRSNTNSLNIKQSSLKKYKNPVTAPPHAAKFEVLPFVPVKSEKHWMDSICYHGQTALVTLLWMNVTHGVPGPGLIEEDRQRL